MSRGAATRYAVVSGVIALIAGAVVLGWGPWAVLGWGAMSLIGVAGGSWQVSLHGTQGARFLLALGTCMLARLIASVGGALVAGIQEPEAIWPYLVGLVAGFVPLQILEGVWFYRRSRTETR